MKRPPEHRDWANLTLGDPAHGPVTAAAEPLLDEPPAPAAAPRRPAVPLELLTSMVAALWQTADPVGADEPGADRSGDARPVSSGALRRSARRGSVVPAAVLAYALLSGDAPHRGATIGVVLALLASCGAIWGAAPAIARSTRRQAVTISALLGHLGAYALLAHLDGGPGSPLGLLVVFAVVYLAVSVAFRPFVVLAGWSALVYLLGVVVGDGPAGPALVQGAVVLGTAAVAARHSAALTALRHRLAEISRIDPATGYLNQRGFDERLEQELSRAARTGQPLTLVVVDPDLGPGTVDGDELAASLQRTSRALGATARAHDAIGRLGRDDFALILTDTGPDAAAIVVERLRGALAGTTPARVGHASFPREAAHPQALHRLATQRSNAYRFARRRQVRPPSAHRPTASPPPRLDERARRPLAIAELAAVAALLSACTALHALVGSTGSTGALLALSVPGVIAAAAVLARARSLSRTASGRLAMGAVAGPLAYALVLVSVGVAGGGDAPLALALLAPVPVLALHLPRRAAAVAAGVATALYLLVCGLGGSPGLWHLLFHLAGVGLVTVAALRRQEQATVQLAAFTDLSLVDGLTDTLNRRGLEERFEVDMARTYRQGGQLSVLAIDLESFDELRREEGRDAARALLRWVAATLAEATRGHDVVGRLDGDEFVVLVTDGGPAEARATADRLRQRLAERVAIGVGTATLGRHGSDFETLHRYAVTARGAAKAHRVTPEG